MDASSKGDSGAAAVGAGGPEAGAEAVGTEEKGAEGGTPEWSKVWDPSSETYYYYNNNTGDTQCMSKLGEVEDRILLFCSALATRNASSDHY